MYRYVKYNRCNFTIYVWCNVCIVQYIQYSMSSLCIYLILRDRILWLYPLNENAIRNGQKLILSLRCWLCVTRWVFDDWCRYVYLYYIYIISIIYRFILFQHVDQFSSSKSELFEIPDGLWSSWPPSAFNVAWNRSLHREDARLFVNTRSWGRTFDDATDV